MMTNFIFRRVSRFVLLLALCFTCSGVVWYACRAWSTIRVPVNKSFYFLVSTSTHVEAGAHFAVWKGGSGYILEERGQEFVVLSVYLAEEDALAVQASLGTETTLKKRCVESLLLRKRSERASREYLQGAFSILYDWLTLLEQETNRLAKGCTQQSSRQTLTLLKRQMEYGEKTNTDSFFDYAQLCRKGAEALARITEKTIYVTDLRYLLCELCVGYCNLAEQFVA